MSPPNAGREAGRADRFYRWLLLTGNRNAIAAAVAGAVFLTALVVTGGYLPPNRVPAVPVLRLSSALAGGLLPFITLVLTINQLALSMELGSVFHLQRRLDAMREFRDDVVDATGCGTCPARPAPLLEALLAAIDDHATTLADAEADDLAAYGRDLTATVDRIEHRFTADSGMFDALVAARRYDPGAHIHDLERLSPAGDQACADALAALETLQEHLDVAQKYFWTVYVEDEMAKLARLVLYTGAVALLASVALTLGYDHLLALGLDGRVLAFVVAVGVTLGLLPFAILFAYMLRIATVARTSAGFGPFTTDGPGWD